MDYKFDEKRFEKTFIKANKLKHDRKYINCFPYAIKDIPIVDFENVTGMYLCNLQNEKPQYTDMLDISNKLIESVEIEERDKEIFKEVTKKLYFDTDKNMLKQNLYMIKQGSYKEPYLVESNKKQSTLEKEIKKEQTSENKIAEYLSEILGEKEKIQEKLNGLEADNDKYNICEILLLDIINGNMKAVNNDTSFSKVFYGFDDVYYNDFKYVINSMTLTKEYLQILLELYYFVYTAQTAILLDRMEDGQRNNCFPLYYSLEWEKTSQSRKCYSSGWKDLHNCLKQIFAHENTLELLNQVENNPGSFDYIKLKEMASLSKENDESLSKEISKIREMYSLHIDDNNPELKIFELEKGKDSELKTVNEYKYLFQIVKKQFEETGRKKPYDKYSNKLIDFCKNKFVKNRGRSGGMLNLTEEMIIFLTKLSLKDEEKMRLNGVFLEFEKRGIYLDEKSKEELDKYYEKLNLIEKKSDSGDAKYVKRIL